MTLYYSVFTKASCLALLASSLCIFAVAGEAAVPRLAGLDTNARSGKHPAATRDVAQYLDLEYALLDATAKRDHAGIAARLAPDFSMRWSSQAESSDAETWIRQQFSAKVNNRAVEGLSVRHLHGVAIVSFYLHHAQASGANSQTEFVVDVWSEADNKLHARMSSKVKPLPSRPQHPTGKE